MPGLFGIVAPRPTGQLSLAFARMFDGARPELVTESGVDAAGHWALGRTHLGVLQPTPQLHPPEHVQVLFHGDLYSDNAAGAAKTATSVVNGAYQEHGADFGRHVDGAYCAAIVDVDRRRALLTVDAVGSYPLYWVQTAQGLVFASELAAVLRHPAVRRALDPRAVADYITFGFPLGTKTLADGVALVPPGSTLVYDMEADAVSITRFANVAEAFDPWSGTESDYIDALRDAFATSIERTFSGQHRFGLSLSGGLDSRAILSGVNGRSPELATYTLGVKGCADEVIAERLAGIAGTRHTFFELDDRYLKDFIPNLERMVSLTDGMYLSHGLTEILALDFLRSADFSVLLRGHGGELAKTSLAWPLHTDAQVEAFTSTDELTPYLLNRVNYISRALDAKSVFTDAWATLVDGAARTSLAESLAGVPLGPADLCSYLYLTEHHRRSTIPSLEIFRRAVEVRMPFVDAPFLGVLLRAHPAWRSDTRIHKALTGSGDIRLLRVRNSNTGAPGNAGPMLEFALDKVNSLFKRLNVSGYRHYHNFQGWMRARLFESVETVLLSPQSLDRGALRESGVRRLLDDTRAGHADHSYLLQVLLILELWQRQNL